MRTKFYFVFELFLLCSIFYTESKAQTLPFVYTVENTAAGGPKITLPTFNQLPVIQSLPDPFKWSDGRGRIVNYSDWKYRRAEIKAQIENYEIGIKPNRPDTITASYSGGVLTVNVTIKGRTLTLTSQITLPSGTGPFPAVIGMNSPSGSIPPSIFSSRNIAQITFNHNQVTVYSNPQNSDPYYQLYPAFNIDNTGQYSAWAWGVSRIIDGLELVQSSLPIDLKHIAVTGCSYAGKMALFAGALDERIALTIAQESGGGGATSWRYSHTETSGSVECIDNTDYNWFMNSMKQFAGNNVSLMPEDHHELMAMVAPRALLVTANPDYTWLSNLSCYVCSKACQQIYNSLGVPERFGYSIIGGHSHCAVPSSQTPEIEAFVDKFLLSKDVNTNIATASYSIDLSPWITWTAPVLANNQSYFSQTNLVYPVNSQKSMDKTITFKWNKSKDAAKYVIQLSTDPLFSGIAKSDSTTTDTTKTISGLQDGKNYYWRVQLKNNSGSAGPWSESFNFSTYIALPDKPQLFSATPIPNRTDYMTLTWKKAKNADKYIIQVNYTQTFTYPFKTDSVSIDTVKSINGLLDGYRYYWRVQSKNVTGTSAWSDLASFSTLPAPINLAVKRSSLKEITLNWNDNYLNIDGHIIERKQSVQASYSLLDTLKGNGTEYIDKKVDQGQTYFYRIKAYNSFTDSDYSNEISLSLVSVENIEIPVEFSLGHNYPNPFNPSTKIKFALPKTAVTNLVIYDSLGREVQTMVSKELPAGFYELNFEANNLPSGIYFYRIQSGEFTQTRKMIIMK